MAGDLAPYGILVNAIAPGVYDTEMTHDALDAPGSLVLKNRVALKRFGREGEMNGALIYFASDACTYTTGQLLVIDGGIQVCFKMKKQYPCGLDIVFFA